MMLYMEWLTSQTQPTESDQWHSAKDHDSTILLSVEAMYNNKKIKVNATLKEDDLLKENMMP